ncbi:hypothetical protein Tco_0694531 [Tanacetum coccineum]
MTPHHVPLGFGSIAGGLDHVNPVIRLPLECGISRVLGLGIMEMEPDIENMTLNEYFDNEVDIECMTIAEYNLYIPKQSLGNNPLNNHSYGFTSQSFAQPPHAPNTLMDKKDSDFNKILDDLFRIGANNLKRIGPYIVQDSICEQDVDLEEDQEEDGITTRKV